MGFFIVWDRLGHIFMEKLTKNKCEGSYMRNNLLFSIFIGLTLVFPIGAQAEVNPDDLQCLSGAGCPELSVENLPLDVADAEDTDAGYPISSNGYFTFVSLHTQQKVNVYNVVCVYRTYLMTNGPVAILLSYTLNDKHVIILHYQVII